ncbi:MAG: hypothetical protein M1835_004859 [Candelina submexicana]|nr:MAG: hypothetical protein M1835_004859 [Candelina submexicana]
MPLQGVLQFLGDEIIDPEEESFLLFSLAISSQNLGFVDSKAVIVELSIAGQDLTIHQSPTILSSNRKKGTTGAVLWKITPLFAEWMVSPGNVLFQHGVLGPESTLLELGCGISGVVGLVLAPKINSFIATDQDYVMKLLGQNIAENSRPSSEGFLGRKSKGRKQTGPANVRQAMSTDNIRLVPLDWELNSLATLPSLLPAASPDSPGENLLGLDAVLACDCIYNESLIKPFVQTCADICSLRKGGSEARPTLCIIAQQLRSSEVFEGWLVAFHELFRVWRVPDRLLTEDLRENSGFVVHVGILRNDQYKLDDS